jgi:hypothetical protein
MRDELLKLVPVFFLRLFFLDFMLDVVQLCLSARVFHAFG